MSFALLIIFMFVAFGLTTLCRRWMDLPTLLAVAIGAAVNANIFTPILHPIEVGKFTFSMEIVLYTLFMYTIVVIISAFIELVARLADNVPADVAFKELSYYLFSSVGTIIGVWVMVFITIKCRNKKISSYLIIPFAIIASSIIHSLFYYGGIALVEWRRGVYTLFMGLSAIMGKGVCILLAMLCYFINQKFWVPLNLRKKQEESNLEEREIK